MSRYFTHYWTNDTCDDMRTSGAEGELLDHLAGNDIIARGVADGDTLYVITVRKGLLCLIGKMQVARIVSQTEAAVLLDKDPQELWSARHHVIAGAATPMHFDLLVPLSRTRELRFRTKRSDTQLKFSLPGVLDQQTLRGMRELTPASAQLLDQLLETPRLVDKMLDFIPTADPRELEQRVARLRKRHTLPRPQGQLTPRQIQTVSVGYIRDPTVKAWVLEQARGYCELCGQIGPFLLPSGESYLEVHHVKPLAAGGPDVVTNAAALCPNCHRRLHLATDAVEQQAALYHKIGRLIPC